MTLRLHFLAVELGHVGVFWKYCAGLIFRLSPTRAICG